MREAINHVIKKKKEKFEKLFSKLQSNANQRHTKAFINEVSRPYRLLWYVCPGHSTVLVALPFLRAPSRLQRLYICGVFFSSQDIFFLAMVYYL